MLTGIWNLRQFETAKLVKFLLMLAFECHSHTCREYLRNHRHYMYYFVKTGMQTKIQGQK